MLRATVVEIGKSIFFFCNIRSARGGGVCKTTTATSTYYNVVVCAKLQHSH